MKTVHWMFSGQGSQYFQMARELHESDRVFRGTFDRADEVLRPLLNESLAHELYRPRADRFEPFRRILHSHPAILTSEYAMAQSLLARGLRPTSLVAHSLGELTAFVVAGVLDFEAALVSIVKQACVVEYCAPPGGMLVVLDGPELVERSPDLFGDCEVTGHYFKRSFVVSGTVTAVQRTRRLLKERQIDTHELPVPHPFHSQAMDVVKAPILAAMAGLKFGPPQIPLFSVALAEWVKTPSAEHLWTATRRMTDFPRAVSELERSGPNCYVDLGPGGSMATAVKYNLEPQSKSEFFPLITPFGNEARNIDRMRTRVGGG